MGHERGAADDDAVRPLSAEESAGGGPGWVGAAGAGWMRIADPVVRELVRALALVVSLLRVPTLVVVLLPLPPAVPAAVLAILLGGWWMLAAGILLLLVFAAAAWLWALRRAAIRAASSREELAEEITRGLDVAGAWDDARVAAGEVRDLGAGRGPMRRVRQGLRALGGLRSLLERFQFAEFPRLRSFLPPRLPWTGYLIVATLAGAAALVVLVIVEAIALVVGAAIPG